MNYTEMNEKLSGNDQIWGIAPRWFFAGKVFSENEYKKFENSEMEKAELQNAFVYILLIDSKKEIDIGAGKNSVSKPLGAQQCYITETALELLGFDFY